MFVSGMIARHGTTYAVKRNGFVVFNARGLQNKDEIDGGYIGFEPGQDIKSGDILINPAGDEFYVSETKTDFFNDVPYILKVKCMSSVEKQQADELFSLVRKITEDEIAPSKGILSNFSDIMERNSWITGSVTSALLGWMMTKIP